MKKVLLLLAACAFLVSAMPAFAEGIHPNDWIGDWDFTYEGSVTDTVTFTDVCVAPDCPQGTIWTYIVKGKKSDDTPIQIRKIKFVSSQAMYYELTDAQIDECGQDCPNATILDADADCNAFTVSAKMDPITLVSGVWADGTRECFTDNDTDNKTCPAIKALGADNPKLEQLRSLRDSMLAKTAIGRKMIDIYYSNAAAVNAAFDRSPALQTIARKVFEAAALLK